MKYSDKFQLVRASLISYSKQCISENWNKMFDMWLSCEADMEFGHGYQNKFKEQFSQYMNSDIEHILWLSGKNIIYAICSFMEFKTDANLNDVLDFTEKFLTRQLDDFDNNCDTIMMAMYEETSECERESGQ